MTTPETPALGIKDCAHLLGSPARWQLLLELAKGEALPTTELARRLGLDLSSTSKHLAILRKLKLAQTGYGRLYTLTPAYRPAPNAPTRLDLGPCQLILAQAPPTTSEDGADEHPH